MSWKEIIKYTNKSALGKLAHAIVDFLETPDINMEPLYDNPWHNVFTRKLERILNEIERELAHSTRLENIKTDKVFNRLKAGEKISQKDLDSD